MLFQIDRARSKWDNKIKLSTHKDLKEFISKPSQLRDIEALSLTQIGLCRWRVELIKISLFLSVTIRMILLRLETVREDLVQTVKELTVHLVEDSTHPREVQGGKTISDIDRLIRAKDKSQVFLKIQSVFWKLSLMVEKTSSTSEFTRDKIHSISLNHSERNSILATMPKTDSLSKLKSRLLFEVN